jgi:hypothetical protein
VLFLAAGGREMQAWIADLVNDDKRWSGCSENPTRVAARLRPTAAVCSTVPLRPEALKRSRAETVAMVAALPAGFLARKHSDWRLGHELLEPAEHTEQHCHQMRAAIERADQP